MEYCLVNIVLGDTALPKINKNKQQAQQAGAHGAAQSAKDFAYTKV